MKRCFNAVVAASLAASLAVPVPQAFADDAQPDASAQQSAQAVETGGDASHRMPLVFRYVSFSVIRLAK